MLLLLSHIQIAKILEIRLILMRYFSVGDIRLDVVIHCYGLSFSAIVCRDEESNRLRGVVSGRVVMKFRTISC